MFPFSYDVRVFVYLGHVSRGWQKCWHKGWGVQQSQCIPVCFCGLTTKIEWLSNSVKVSIAVDIDNKRFIRLCIFHVTALTHRILENSETCWLFAEKLRTEALLKLLPSFNGAQSSDDISIPLHNTMVFKTHYSAPLGSTVYGICEW